MDHPVNRIEDPEVRWLASLGATLREDYVNVEQDRLWKDSPFDWIRPLPSRRKGKIGEQLVAGWCAAKGFDVTAAGDSDADRVIAGQRVEIKLSTLWANGIYKFQQLRDQRYAHVICVGISPFDAQCWVIPKAVIWEKLHRSMAGRGAAIPDGCRSRRPIQTGGSPSTGGGLLRWAES